MSPKFRSQAQQLFCAPASQSRMHDARAFAVNPTAAPGQMNAAPADADALQSVADFGAHLNLPVTSL